MALDYHRFPTPGKISVTPTTALANQRDLSLAYSPGVAEACMLIVEDEDEAAHMTVRANLVGVVTNGMAARFHHDGGLEPLLARIGGISDSRRIRYWSVTRKRWRDLVDDAYALSSADPAARRQDFSADELVPGKVLHFVREPNSPIGAAVFQMVVLTRDEDRLTLKVENSSPIRLFRVAVLAPGEQELLVFLERESEGVWRFYSLTRTGEGIAWRARQRIPSYVNRAVAEYRHLVGIPTDHEPPAIP